MRAIVLAAGLGRRLAGVSGGRPKALVEVGGMPLLEWTLRALETAAVAEIVIVTGYRADDIERFVLSRHSLMPVAFRFNPDYATANNIVSLLAAAEEFGDGACILNSDTLFDPLLAVKLVSAGKGSWLMVDGEEPLGSEEMKVVLDAGGLIRQVSKELTPEASAGEYIGLARFDTTGAKCVLDAARDLVDAGRTDVYYEDAIEAAAAYIELRPLWTGGRAWTEVDDDADHRRAIGIASALNGSGR